MRRRLRNVVFVSIIFTFSLFNIYKSLNNNNTQHFISFFHLPWQHTNNNKHNSNKSSFDTLFQVDHTPLKDKLLKLGKPHNNTHYNNTYVVIGDRKRKQPFWQMNLKLNNPTTNTTKPEQQHNIFGDVIEESRFLVVVLQVQFLNIFLRMSN